MYVDCVWNVMAHEQKPDFVFRRNGRDHLNRQGRQFSRLLAAEACASAVVMLDTPSSEVVWSGVKGTGNPLHSPVSPSPPRPWVTVCHHVTNAVYNVTLRRVRVTAVAVKNQYYTFWMCVCGLIYPACKAHAPYNTVWCGQSSSITFFHIVS